MKRGSPGQTSLSAFIKKARTEIKTEQESNNEPAEIENDTTCLSTATVSINISQSSQCDVTIQSTSASTTTSISTTYSSTVCTVCNDISKSKDDDHVQPMKSSFPKKRTCFGKCVHFKLPGTRSFHLLNIQKIMMLFTVFVAGISHPVQESMKMLLKVDSAIGIKPWKN